MKCRSVACIWPEAPPSHRVTAAAALDRPPTVYTGGSDGSILWWNLSPSPHVEIIKPVAMLCGHVAPVADLGICYPVVVPGETGGLSNGALISACTEGVLCVWSRSSGHCRRRRKLPPWAGSPSVVRALPSSPRYACIGCCFGVGSDDRKSSRKCSVVIVDTYSLTIVQTVFHGDMSFGTLKFMDVVLSGEDGENASVFMADSFGGVKLVPILKDMNIDVEGDGKGPQLEAPTWENWLNGEEHVSCTARGNLVALLLEKNCIFRLLTGENIVGDITFVEKLLPVDDNAAKLHLSGCMFVGTSDPGNMQEASDDVCEQFCVWNNMGSALVYDISYSENVFKCELLSEIPVALSPVDFVVSVSFIHLSNYLVRISMTSSDLEEPIHWKPHITVWTLPEKHKKNETFPRKCSFVAESLISSDWMSSSSSLNQFDSKDQMIGCLPSSVSSIGSRNGRYPSAISQKKRTVSSSMVISENLIVPYAVVYGFYSGEIEVILFDMFLRSDSPCGSPRVNVDIPVSRKYFLGHTGAVLCLAEHRMSRFSSGQTLDRVLISGSVDCTIRIWDVDSGILVTVLHQHSAPVRQLMFAPALTAHPWSDCFLSVGEDSCVALTSLETLQVERLFPGHPGYPEKVVWDGTRGYVGCLCKSQSGTSDAAEFFYIWDVKTGARERVLRGPAAHSMLEYFCKEISVNSNSASVLSGNTSVSSLLLPIIEDGKLNHSHVTYPENQTVPLNVASSNVSLMGPSKSQVQAIQINTPAQFIVQRGKHPIQCTCPFPGVAALSFDLASLMCSYQKLESSTSNGDKPDSISIKEGEKMPSLRNVTNGCDSRADDRSPSTTEEPDWIRSLEEHLLCFSLSFLHIWNLDTELDKLLIADMNLSRPRNCLVASGLQGDKGSLTLTFPGPGAVLELWKSSSEFCAMRSLTMVSIAQRMITMTRSGSAASSSLAAFYTRNFIDKIPDIKPPSLQGINQSLDEALKERCIRMLVLSGVSEEACSSWLLVSFWQDESEHVRMAARTLFHCAASRAIPFPLCSEKATHHVQLMRSLSGVGEYGNPEVQESDANGSDSCTQLKPTAQISANVSEEQAVTQLEESNILTWMESFEVQDWISCIGGTSQDAMTSHIIVAAALIVWYRSLLKPTVAMLVVHPLIKLIMAMNGKWSCTAAELLAEGMETTWKACCGSEIPRLISDIIFQIECINNPSANSAGQRPSVPTSVQETLAGVLLPNLAMADILGFLTIIESQIWSTASDSPVHLVSLATLVRVMRGSPRCLVPYLDKVVNYILHTMDLSNLVMRKTCLQSSMAALKEAARVFPMVALNETATRLAVGDSIGEINSATISVYDMQSVMKIKVLDASGPPGLPTLLSGTSELPLTTLIAALSISPDGEGLVAFSEHGLMIRWWSLGSVWWEKLSRNLVPVQCTKLIFVPPWEGFSPNYSRLSIMSSIIAPDRQYNLQEHSPNLSHADCLKLLLPNLDLTYRLEWVGARKVLLTRHGQELGTFLL